MSLTESSSKYEKELYTRVGEVLHYIWDPIGVRGHPEARDEYDVYVPQVYLLLQGGATAEQIALHLDKVVTERIELNSNMERSLMASQKLLDWRAVLLRKRPEILG
jgi:hypothetical protein